MAERERLWVWLCDDCHRALHDHGVDDYKLMREAQEIWERDYIEHYPYKNHGDLAAREAFIRIFGKNFIYEETN